AEVWRFTSAPRKSNAKPLVRRRRSLGGRERPVVADQLRFGERGGLLVTILRAGDEGLERRQLLQRAGWRPFVGVKVDELARFGKLENRVAEPSRSSLL